ncbi:MAG: ketoacyl-ACP synthase III [Deltaproteobacteria bacterium]|nr:ketoacyl-ACP synthase III [Deltaproteobacteria bacterium]
MGAFVLGTGSYLPRRVLTNAELEGMVETSDEWITSRTGIKTRHIAGAGEETSLLAVKAAQKALEMAGLGAEELDLILVATITSEMTMPSCACLVQKELGAVHAFAYDLNAACSGFLYGLDMADAYLRRNPAMKIMVIGAETLSSRTNWQDRNTCIIFGDGAGACIVGGTDRRHGVLASKMFADGRLHNLLFMDSARGMNPDLSNAGNQGSYIKMAGRDVFKHAVRAMSGAVTDVMSTLGLEVDAVRLFIPHQANIRILHSLLERLHIPPEKVYVNVSKYGNTSAASVPIALDEANRAGMIAKDDLVLLCAFGGGFTWGAMVVRW